MTKNGVILEVMRGHLRARGELVVSPAGFSMGRRYRGVEGLVFRPVPSRLRVGDVVAFARGDRWVVHRILAVRGEHVLTKGDALSALDDPDPARHEVEAVLVARVVKGRRLKEGRLYAWFAVLCGWLRYWMARLWR